MRNRFDHQLLTLNTELITMGALCEEAISSAAKYLIDKDEKVRENVYETDKEIDRKERDIEALCMKLLLMEQPVAKDLRTVSSALKMISDMERIGDQAADIAEMAEYVKDKEVHHVHIADMARETIAMVSESVESFVRKDEALARNVFSRDDTVDALFVKVKKELIDAEKSQSEDAESLMDLLMIAKYFERIGDHAENIAEWVIYSLTGEHVS